MELNELLAALNDAVASKNWLLVVLLTLLILGFLLDLGFRAFGKEQPIIGTVVKLLSAITKTIPAKQAPPPADGKEGVAAVAPVEKVSGLPSKPGDK